MTFSEWSNQKHKKKKEQEQDVAPSSYSSFADWSNAKYGVDVDDIAPVASISPVSRDDDEEEERTWFRKGAFEDGYQAGDIANTLFGSLVDIGENVTAGILGMGEKAVDAGAYLVGGAAGLLGNDDFRDKTAAFIQKDLYNEEEIAKKIILGDEEYSVFGEKSDALVQSAGQLAGTLGLQMVGVPWFITSGVTGFGSEAENALNQGASYGKAGLSATISAGAEILTEKLFGGSGLGEKGLIAVDALTKGITNKAVKVLADLGVDVVTEGSEEVVSEFMSNLGSSLYREENLGDILFSEEAVDGYIEAAIGGGVLGGLMNTSHAVKAAKTGRDYRTGLSDNEQKVIDKVYNDELAEAEKSKGEKLTEKEKAKLYDKVVEGMAKGDISTDVIEEVLGGDSYKAYQEVVKNSEPQQKAYNNLKQKRDALKTEYEALLDVKQSDKTDRQIARKAEIEKLLPGIEKQMANLKKQDQRPAAQKKLSESVMGLVAKDRLAESYRQNDLRRQEYNADLSKYNDKQKVIIQNALDSGVLNNSRRTHEFVDMIAKIGADRGVEFEFLNNEKLMKSRFGREGAFVNGFWDKKNNTIGVNIDSKKALNATVGHEITHVLEGTELYNQLQNTLFEYAKSKGEYDSRKDALSKLYSEADIPFELAADLVGDYLFSDEDFVRHLSTADRNLFQKVWDEIKYLCKVATAGSKEARELEKVKRAFEKAYREGGKAQAKSEAVTNSDAETKFSLVEDQKTIDFLENQDHITTYKAMVLIDGKLYPPMASQSRVEEEYTDKKGNKKTRTVRKLKNPSVLGRWQQADENPGAIKKFNANGVGVFELLKSNGKTVPAAYNPYEHTSNIVLNDQFEEAYNRPELVTVEYHIPVSEMTSGYKAQYAKDAVGLHEWKSGPVAKDLKDPRKVYLTRWSKPVRILPDSEVAAKYKEILDGTGLSVPFNVVTPSLLSELEKAGVPIDYDGSPMYQSIKKRAAEKDVKYSLSDSTGKQLTPEQSEFFKDSKMRDENGNLKVMYHGTSAAGFHVFDGSMSDDGTSFFFTDRNDVAGSYSGTSETYEAKTIRTAEDMNNFLVGIGYGQYEAVERDGKFELLEDGDVVAESDTAQGIYEEFCWYEGVGDGEVNYKVYLNLTNPFVVDGKGRYWDALPPVDENGDVYEYIKLVAFDYMTDNATIEYALNGDSAPVTETVNLYAKFDDEIASRIEDLSPGESISGIYDKPMTTRDYAAYAKTNGYDGVIFNNIVDVAGYEWGDIPSTVAVAFDSNQIKSVANEKPTADPDIRYSLSDSNGRQLSDEQAVYFKDSKVRDENGSLKVMYHGTPNGNFTVFKDGTYFTDSKEYADGYQNPNASMLRPNKDASAPKTFEVYLDIKKPFDLNDAEARRIYIEEYIKGGNALGINPYLSDAEYAKIKTVDWTEGEDLRDFLIDEGYDYDGLILDEGAVGGYGDEVKSRGTSYVVFSPEQVKSVDNQNPTDNPDIRFSLSENGDAAPVASYAEIEEERQKLRQREIRLEARKREANNNPDLLQAMDDVTNLFGEARELFPKKRNGTATQAELDRIEEIKRLREERLKRVADLQESLGLNAIAEEEREIRESKEALRIASDAAWAREGAEKENKAIAKAGLSAPEYFRKKALKAFKTTTNFNEAGYLLPDGKLLNFSGGERNHRYRDHREIGEIYEATNGVAALNRFLSDGNIRVMAESPGIDIAAGVEPTKEQYAAIRKFVNSHGTKEGQFFVDFSDAEGHRAGNYSYEGRVNADRVLNDIKHYYATGEIREQSSIGNFLSLSNLGETPKESSGWNVYGKDIAYNPDIAPVAEDAAADASLPTDVAPMGEDEPVQAADQQQGATSQETNKAVDEKIRNFQTELERNVQLREQAAADYDADIEMLQAEYDALKNKTTLKANNLLRRIERTKRLKANADVAYEKRIGDLESRIQKMNTTTYRTAAQRKAKQGEHFNWAANLIGDTSTWVDKKLGIQYATNTLRRNLRDIVRDASGNKDIAKADAIDDALSGEYNHNEADLKRESAQIKKPFADLKLTDVEDAYVQMLGEFRHNPDTELTKEAVQAFYEKNKANIDEAKVDRAIEMARQSYDSLLERVNTVLREQGMKEIPYRKGYFPHFTEEPQSKLAKLLNWKTQKTDIPTSIAGLTEQFNPNRSWQSFNKQRKGDTTDYSFTKGFDAYAHGALDWIYHIEDIQKRRAVENYIRYTHSEEGVKSRIDAIRANDEYDAFEAQEQIELVLNEANNPLNNFVTDFRTGTNILANKKSSFDRGVEQWTNRHIYSVMTNLSNRVSANMVAGSVSSAMTNFIPITQSWGEVSPISSLRAMGDTIRAMYRDDGVVDKSDFLTNRLRTEENLHKTTWDKIGDKVGIMTDVVDNFTSQTVWRSKYLENISKGMSEAESIKNADQFAENVIAGRSRGNMPTIFNAKNPLAKTLTAFQLEVANQYGYMFKDMPTDLRNEATGKLVKGYATMFVGAYAYNALYSSLAGRDAAFDPIGILEDLLRDLGFGDEEEEEPADVVLNFAGNIAEELPFVGGLLGGGRIPISAAIPYSGEYEGLEGFVTDVANNDWKSVAKELANPLYYLAMPMGGGQIRKTVQGLQMFSDDHPVAGSYTDSGNLRYPVEDTFLNRLQAGVFGQYANANARDYFDNNRSPLKEKQIQEYIDVDIPIRDYWDYREGLNKQDSLEDKFDYIAGLDLSVEQKNILINNVVDRKGDVDMENYDDFGSFEEFDWYSKNTEKYNFLQEQGVSYSEYKSSDDAKERYDSVWSWYNNYPEKVTVAKAVTDNMVEYRQYTSDMNDIHADKDASGKSISGSRKTKVFNYINNLDVDYGAKLILWKSEYPSDDSYNYEICEYLDSRDDLSNDEKVTIMQELGFIVGADGTITW